MSSFTILLENKEMRIIGITKIIQGDYVITFQYKGESVLSFATILLLNFILPNFWRDADSPRLVVTVNTLLNSTSLYVSGVKGKREPRGVSRGYRERFN